MVSCLRAGARPAVLQLHGIAPPFTEMQGSNRFIAALEPSHYAAEH